MSESIARLGPPPPDWRRQCVEQPRPGRRHALILCNGLPPPPDLLHRGLEDAELFIAADGGAVRAARLGVRPDVVVGDLDSFSREESSRRGGARGVLEGVRVEHRPDQESNDLEKALDYALARGMESASILGATGLRLDHTLKNLSVLKRYRGRLCLWMADAHHTIWLCGRGAVIRGEIGQPLSLFPLSGRASGIWTDGLRYPLHGESLENGHRDGTSNALEQSTAYVWVGEGDLLLFLVRPENA